MVAPHSAARESTTQLAWDLLQPSRSHRLARAAATSSTALHWVESRHCTALHCTAQHEHNDTAEYLPAGQTLLQLLQCIAKFVAVTTTL